MKSYLAVSRDEKMAIYLSKSDQMDQHLAKGESIYEIDEDGARELIATPEKGYLTEKPIFPIPQTMYIGGNNAD